MYLNHLLPYHLFRTDGAMVADASQL